MTNQTPPRKMRPKADASIVSPGMVVAGAIIGGLLLLAAVIVALSDDNEVENDGAVIFATATPAPIPTYVTGTLMAEGDTLYALEPVIFSIAAGVENSTGEQALAKCDAVLVSRQNDGSDFVYLQDDTTYWVYARASDAEKGWNGWLPLAALSNERPADCG